MCAVVFLGLNSGCSKQGSAAGDQAGMVLAPTERTTPSVPVRAPRPLEPGKIVEASADDGPGINVRLATYGGNCGANRGNATTRVARACGSRQTCEYVVDGKVLGDATPLCPKDWEVEWRCGTAPGLFRNRIPAEAGLGSHSTLSCDPAARAAAENKPAAPPAIHVVEATYGGNCMVRAGNATAAVQEKCRGQATCVYVVDIKKLGDPKLNCAKDFRVTWTCGADGVTHSERVPPEAGLGSGAHLACP